MPTLMYRAVPSRLLTDPHAVRHFGKYRAANRAMRADIFPDGGPCHVGTGRFRFLHTGERYRSNCRQTAGDQTGTAQKTTAIETNPGWAADGRCKTAATCLALCSFDQHGSASLSSDIG